MAGGVLYTLSPSLVVVALALAAMGYWAQSDQGPDERRWFLAVFVASLLVRAVLLVWFLYEGEGRDGLPVMVGDEWLIKWRALLLLQRVLGSTLAPPDFFNMYEYYGHTSLIDVFGYWQLWFGPAPYGVHLLNLAFWYLGAVMLYRATRQCFGKLPALVGFTLLLFTPTLLVWSMSALKEPIYFLLTAVAIVGASRVWYAPSVSGRVVGLVLAAAAMVAIAPVRSIALFVTAAGVGIGTAGWFATRRTWLALASVVVLLLGGAWAVQRPDVQARIMKEYRAAATAHLGNVRTDGYAYHLLDDRFYLETTADPTTTITPMEAVRFTGRALLSFFAEPLPWRAATLSSIAFIPQQMSWYVLALLAIPGLVAGWRRAPAFTWLLFGNIIVGLLTVALFNGNVGTFVRFRDSVVTIICWLSALGGCAVAEWLARHFSREVFDGTA